MYPTLSYDDFDEASKAWRMNKIHKGGGYYVYKCENINKLGKQCKNKVCKPEEKYCVFHIKHKKL